MQIFLLKINFKCRDVLYAKKLVQLPIPTILLLLSTISSLSTSYMCKYVCLYVCFNSGCTMLSVCLVAICPISRWRSTCAPVNALSSIVGHRLRWPDHGHRDTVHFPHEMQQLSSVFSDPFQPGP